MNTKLFNTKDKDINEAADIIGSGGLVAFPTETVYGLGADALDPDAVKRIYQVKGRPSDNPMIVHIGRASDIGMVTPVIHEDVIALIDNFWPGPLTLVVKKNPEVPDITTGGMGTVAVRMPDNPVALKLIRAAGVPIAAPSANLSGRPSPTRSKDVISDLDGKIEGVVVGEDCRIGIESTVVDMTADHPMILRPGTITADDIKAVLDKPVTYAEGIMKPCDSTIENDSKGENPGLKSPGMKYKHYAPNAEMIVIEGQRDRVGEEIKRLKAMNERIGNKVGIILFEEKAFVEAAHDFFARLRDLDEANVDLILAGALSDTDGVGFAVMNRMLKSAGYNVVKV